MKKLRIILFSLLGLLLLAILFLPGAMTFSETVKVDRPWQPFERNVVNKAIWQKWWPGKQVSDSVFEYKGKQFYISNVLLNGFQAHLVNDTLARYGFQFAAIENKQTSMTMAAIIFHKPNLLGKLKGWMQYFSTKNEIKSWLQDVKTWFESDASVYGITISKVQVTDLNLIAVKEQMDHMPSTEEIYKLVDELKAYIKQQNGKERNAPNMHIYQESPDLYQLMVAIPTETKLPSTERYLLKEMIPGKLLTAEVKGGHYTAMQAQENLGWYMRDYNKSSPAIPFQSLVTNRMEEPDTTKWITRLYYPVYE